MDLLFILPSHFSFVYKTAFRLIALNTILYYCFAASLTPAVVGLISILLPKLIKLFHALVISRLFLDFQDTSNTSKLATRDFA